jgi:hypothetical protein
MISSILQGGLGNQMFQIAAAVALAKRTGQQTLFSHSNHHLPLQGNRAINYKNNIFYKIDLTHEVNFLSNLIFYKEQNYSYSELPKENDLFLHGYFQSEKYFSDCKEYIKNLFSETLFVKDYIDVQYENLDEAISIHVRRGDYLKFPDTHPVCRLSYYEKAIETIGEDRSIFIFSDDIQWCKENFKFKNMIFVENEPDYIDLFMISRCKHNIIANSSFSWWAAWLNRNEDKKVICPKNWFGIKGPQDIQDIYPEEWIKCY